MKPAVVILSDCGLASVRFAQMAGVIESLAPHTDVSAGSLVFEKNNIPQISAYLFTAVPFWPAGTVFLSDAGEGKLIAVRLPSGTILIGPDNGFATVSVYSFGYDCAWEVSPEQFGSDSFAAARAAAALVSGLSPEQLGHRLEREDVFFFAVPQAKISDGKAEGEVTMLLKTFGNLTFSIATDDFEKTGIVHGDTVEVTFTLDDQVIYREQMTYQPSFGYVPEGAPVIFNGSAGYMDIGLNRKSFIDTCLPEILKAEDPGTYKVCIEKVR